MNDDQQTNDQVVTMSIPVDNVITNPQTETTPPDTLSPSIPQDDIAKAIENVPVAGFTTLEYDQPTTSPDPGRPCEFCQDKENILNKTRQYIESGRNSEKPKMLFLIELAMILGKHRETIMNWAHKKTDDGSLKHHEFFDMIKSVEEMQELRLQQRVLGRYNPTGAIFLLKTKHGYIETDKKILAGDKNEPLQVEIIEERKLE